MQLLGVSAALAGVALVALAARPDPGRSRGTMHRVTSPRTDLSDSPFLRACRRERPDRTPVWFMRQAGRSLPEYRRVREGITMLESCTRPDLVAEITLQPVRRYGVDAAIFFSDIVVPLKAIGVDLDIVPGVGPVVAEPFRTVKDLDRLPALTAADVPYVAEAVQLLVAELGATPLIGFAGAPYTLASYLVEGGPSKNHERTKALMYGDPQLWHALAGRLAAIAGAFLRVQVEAGASAVQLFDSWVGALPPADYVEYVQPHSAHGARRRWETSACRGSTSASARASCSGPWGRRARRWWASTSGSPLDEASRRVGPDRARAGQPRPGDALRAGGGAGAARAPDPRRRDAARPGTCSTSATASPRTPTRPLCSGWSTSSTARSDAHTGSGVHDHGPPLPVIMHARPAQAAGVAACRCRCR